VTVQYLSLRPSVPTADLPAEQTPALPLPDKPTILVLPLTNMSGDPEQEYFSDGITEELITALARFPSLFVIARHSAFTYKGKEVKIQDVGKELGVRYVLEGSVQRAEQRVRINVQLVDALSGEHLWVERYDRPFSDIFTLQDEIVQQIVTTLELQLTLQEQGYTVRKRTDNLEAYDYYLRGMEFFLRFTKEANAQARQMWEKAVELDSQYAEAYELLGATYYMEWVWRWSADPQTLERALVLAQQALALDDSLPVAHSFVSLVYAQQQQYDQAIAEGERAIALDPNHADSYAWQAEVLNLVGRSEEALKMVKQAMRLNPHYPPVYLYNLGQSYRLTGQYTESVTALKEVIGRNPNYLYAYLFLAINYMILWMDDQSPDPQTLEEALKAAQRTIVLNNDLPIAHTVLGCVYMYQKQYEQGIAELRRAVALDPDFVEGYTVLADGLSRIGQMEEALQIAEQALRRKLSGVDIYSLSHIGPVYYRVGRYEEAISTLKQFVMVYPNDLETHLILAAAYSEAGREEEARAATAEVLRLNPNFSLEVLRQRTPLKDPAMLERHLAALRKAGLK
jgi:TolB-like protein/predicted Zn-dependent protease